MPRPRPSRYPVGLPTGPFRRRSVGAAHFDDHGIRSAWALASGYGIRVAVLDSGVDTDHPDLQGIERVEVAAPANGSRPLVLLAPGPATKPKRLSAIAAQLPDDGFQLITSTESR